MSHNTVNRALILSGGGGRGAYQVGVCQRLDEMGWQPDLVLGNSIGATNGALLLAPQGDAAGPELLDAVWRGEMMNEALQAVSDDWPPLLGDLMGLGIEGLQALQLPPDPGAGPGVSFGGSRPWLDEIRALFAAGNVRERLARRLRDGFVAPFEAGMQRSSVMAREGWRDLVSAHVDFDRLNAPDAPHFGIAVTDVATGAPHFFWNRVPAGVAGTVSTLKVDHVMASSSIPGFYEATQVEGRYWWDGALVANSPIGPALDAGAREIVVVLMTPWSEAADEAGAPGRADTPTVLDALDRALDWMMLAPFRSELRRLTPEQRERVRIVAPRQLLGPVSIIDYAEMDNELLIELGYRDARAAL